MTELYSLIFMRIISSFYTLYSCFVSSCVFTPFRIEDSHSVGGLNEKRCKDKCTYSYSHLFISNRKLPFSTTMYLSKPEVEVSPIPNTKNISDTEIKRFIEKIKKYSFKPFVINTFEDW